MDPVLDLLNKKGLYFTVSGRDYLVKCLNPDHEDSNPSMRIDKQLGAFHCFSCGYKGNIFKYYGLSTHQVSIRVAKLKEKLKELNTSYNGVEFPGDIIPINQSIRGISIKTLKKFGAFHTIGDEKLEDRIFFPITDIRGKPRVYVGRHTLSQGNPRYLNYPSGVKMPVFPDYFDVPSKNLILVEGIFDMLNVYDKGIHHVACTFGTNTMDKGTAEKLLPFKVQGVEKIYLMFDGDQPGKDASKKLKPLIEEAGFSCEIIPLEDDTDPGELDQETIDSIKAYINNDT